MPDMLEVVIDSVRVSLMSSQRVVILRQKDLDRYLPVWVGSHEAEAITVALQEVEVARPLTHDLLKNVFSLFNGRISRVEIVALKEDIFYGNLVVEADGKTFNIESRPSDAIALAIRSHAPIFVHRLVMDTAGIVPERDMQQEQLPASPEVKVDAEPAPDAGVEQRLDVFEDFLKKLGDQGEEKPNS
jgi:bifunctional DNase/RNase